jgi:SHS2 domain-containing protein
VYRWLEHTSEVELLVEGRTPEAVFAEAAVALGELLSGAREAEPVNHEVEVEVEAADLPALLAAWLEELVYLAESDGFVTRRIASLELAGTKLSALVSGGRSVPQSLIKAVTYHRLEMAPADGGWRARVVLDV